jgi:hypothetical protein
MNTVSSRKSFAALINFMACAVNAGLAWWLYNKGSDFYVFNVICTAFSGVLAVGNFLGYLEAKDAERAERLYRDIYGR